MGRVILPQKMKNPNKTQSVKNTKKITNINDYSKEVDKIIASKKPIVEQFMDLMGLLDVSFVDTTVNEKNSIPDYISDCCHAPVIAVSGILDTDTFHFECMKCRKACNPIKCPKKQDSSVQDRRVKLTKSDSSRKRNSVKDKKFNLFETLKHLIRK